MDELNTMSLIGPQGNRGQVATWNCQRQGDRSYRNKKYNNDGLTDMAEQSEFYGGMAHRDLWSWLISCGAPRHETDKKPPELLSHLYKQEKFQTNERNWITAKGNLSL